MSKNTRLNAASVILFMATICLVCVGGTHTPWDGTAWDVTSPDIDQLIGNHYKEMFDLRKGVAIRMNKEHETLATASAGGVHKQGSARAFWQDAPPTTQINGDDWDSGDTGSLWFDTNSSPDNLVYVLTNHASTGTWTLLSVSMTAEIVAAAHSWADVQTFDLQTVHTLGILSNAAITLGAGDDLVGSATSAINMNAFDVDENGVATLGTSLDIASTIVVVGTIDDDDMSEATDTTIATSESIVAYSDAVDSIRDMKADDVVGATFGSGSESCTLGNGMIIKAGFATIGGGTTTTVTFADNSAVFPGGALSATANHTDVSQGTDAIVISTLNATTLVMTHSSNVNDNIYWIVIGY